MSFVIEKKKKHIIEILKNKASIEVKVSDLMLPPNRELGDLTLPLFAWCKRNLKEFSEQVVLKIADSLEGVTVEATGPYLNFTFDYKDFAKEVVEEALDFEEGVIFSKKGNGKKVAIEFGQPNTLKAFHIGHFRGITLGESLARLMEALGYEVVRLNYQGDVGLHVAKSLWGVLNMEEEYEEACEGDFKDKALFLGRAYAFGSQQYEEKEEVKKEIIDINKSVYALLEGFEDDSKLKDLYNETREWSLGYFDEVYKILGSKFDKFYFESETFSLGKKLVKKHIGDVFEESEGAIIFPGEREGLHNRVFITSEDNATYEAKDLALVYKKNEEYEPDYLVVLTAKEQSEYFKVVFKVIDKILPELKDKKKHIGYGFVQLKEGKMSSRLGNVITFDELLGGVVDSLEDINSSDKDRVLIALSAMKYAMLKTSASSDVAFDIKSTISVSGQSGPYVLYTYVRFKKILEKGEVSDYYVVDSLTDEERDIVFYLSRFSEVVVEAGESFDPSKVAHYVFDLCQKLNEYYQKTAILNSDNEKMRLKLIGGAVKVIEQSLRLLGVEKVDSM